jgi:inhibitor of KinA
VSPDAVTIAPAGDSGLHLRFAGGVSDETFARVMGVLAALDTDRPAGVEDVMPGYASVLVVCAPAAAADVRTWLEAAVARARPRPPADTRLVEIPVLYDASVAPDLEALAAEKGMTVAALVAAHAAPLYRCHLLGFRPGFPFLGGLDPALAAARLPTPRLSVPAGSVGIGGRQTGIYPGAGPGGWRLIGRTPLRLFEPAREDPFLVHPGDGVRFVPVDQQRFASLA